MTTLEGINSYAYNSNNWLTAVSYPDTRLQQFTYDAVGNRTRLDDSGIGVTPVLYSYDGANRLQTHQLEASLPFYEKAVRLAPGDGSAYAALGELRG